MKQFKIIILSLAISGCATTIEGRRCDPENNCVGFKVKTYNEYPEGYSASLNTKTGEFQIDVGAAVAKPNPLEQIGADVISIATKDFLNRSKNNE